MELIIKAASQLSRIPLLEMEAAMGIVPYIHKGEAIPNALAAAIPKTPSRFPFKARKARWIESLAKTETADPMTIPSTHQPKICSSWTVK